MSRPSKVRGCWCASSQCSRSGRDSACRMSRWARWGCLGLDVADEGDAAEHVAAGIPLVRAAVDDGEGQPIGVAEQHDDRHGKQAVELPGHVGQRGAGIPCAPQFDGEEQVRFEQAGCEGRVLERRAVALHFRVGQLKEQVGLCPVGELRLLRMENLAGGGFGHAAERRGVGSAGDGQGAVATIAERGEQRQAGGAQPGRGERGERGGDVGEGIRGGHRQMCGVWLALGGVLRRRRTLSLWSLSLSKGERRAEEIGYGDGPGLSTVGRGRGAAQSWERGRPARLGVAGDLLPRRHHPSPGTANQNMPETDRALRRSGNGLYLQAVRPTRGEVAESG